MKITYSALSDRGPRRRDNQDNLYCAGLYRTDPACNELFLAQGQTQMPAVFAVADGMGGESNGAETALLSVQPLADLPLPASAADLTRHILRCNQAVCSRMDSAGGERMGSTFAGLSLHDRLAEAANVGDSRLYLFRAGQLTCLSQDHTAVRALVQAGILTPEEAKHHPDRHRLTQHIGIFPDEMLLQPFCTTLAVQKGDQFLLCSDGLTDGLADNQIDEILAADLSPEEKTRLLLRQAMAKTRDNVTAVLLFLDEI